MTEDLYKNIKFQQIDEDELINALDNFYLTPLYLRLEAINNTGSSTFLDIIGKRSSETVHSNFLEWLFSNEDFVKANCSPLKNLILLALRNSNEDQIVCKNDQNPEDFLEGIRTNKLKRIKNVRIEREQSFSLKNQDPAKKQRRAVDLVIECEIEDKSVRLIIENKINSFEHDMQCKAYEIFYDQIIRKKADYTLFIFLAPYTINEFNPLSSDKFISIEYQALTDYIIEPILDSASNYDSKSIAILQQYFDTITSINNEYIMAVSKNYRELLRQFYEENRDLILTAMKYGSDNPQETALAGTTQATDIIARSKSFKLIMDDEQTNVRVNSLADLFYEVIRYIANSGNYSAQKLVDEFSILGKLYASKPLITLTPPTDSYGYPNNRHLTATNKREQLYCSGEKIYVSNQIAFDRSGKDNTTPFIDFVNRNTDKFKIRITKI